MIELADMERILAEQPFARWWGVEAVSVGGGRAAVRLPFRAELTRPGGVLHGPSYEMVADVAMWFAVMSAVGEEQMALTVEMKTSFLRGATTDITSEGVVLKAGRRLVFGIAETRDTDGRLVAHSTLTYTRG